MFIQSDIVIPPPPCQRRAGGGMTRNIVYWDECLTPAARWLPVHLTRSAYFEPRCAREALDEPITNTLRTLLSCSGWPSTAGSSSPDMPYSPSWSRSLPYQRCATRHDDDDDGNRQNDDDVVTDVRDRGGSRRPTHERGRLNRGSMPCESSGHGGRGEGHVVGRPPGHQASRHMPRVWS